jgi:hypothetical protein
METWKWVAIGIMVVACILAWILANRKKWRIEHGTGDDPIEHYTEKRDELTYNDAGIEEDEEDEEVEEESSRPRFSITSLLSGVIGLFVAFLVFSQVMGAVKTAMIDQSMNVSGYDAQLMTTSLNMLDVMFPLMMVIGVIFILLQVFGITGSSSDSDDETPKKRKTRKKRTGVEHYTHARDTLSKTKKRNKNE